MDEKTTAFDAVEAMPLDDPEPNKDEGDLPKVGTREED